MTGQKRASFSRELKIALEAARAAGAIQKKYFEKKIRVSKKGEINLVTEVDEKSQTEIVKRIRKAFPKDAILAEEGDLSRTASSPRRWIVDPLDGTTNFAHGLPIFCISIGFEYEGRIAVGVVYDPLRNEMFSAIRNKGAFRNKTRLQVKPQSNLRDALLVTGFAYDFEKPGLDNRPYFSHMITKAQAVRRLGAAALDLAYVAAGRFDGFWELGLSPWDVAAGWLLVEEAGGVVTSMSGHPYSVTTPDLIAANQEIHRAVLKECRYVKESSL